MDNKKLSDEVLAKMRDCTSPSEVVSLLMEDGMELTDEQLEAVAGGIDDWPLEQLMQKFGARLTEALPAGYDAASIWGGLPTGRVH